MAQCKSFTHCGKVIQGHYPYLQKPLLMGKPFPTVADSSVFECAVPCGTEAIHDAQET